MQYVWLFCSTWQYFSCQVFLYTYSWVSLFQKHHLKLEVGGKVLTSVRMAAFFYDGLRLDTKACHRQNYLWPVGSGDNKSFIILHKIIKLSILYYWQRLSNTFITHWKWTLSPHIKLFLHNCAHLESDKTQGIQMLLLDV